MHIQERGAHAYLRLIMMLGQKRKVEGYKRYTKDYLQ